LQRPRRSSVSARGSGEFTVTGRSVEKAFQQYSAILWDSPTPDPRLQASRVRSLYPQKFSTMPPVVDPIKIS
jgi:hypothetical protein